MLASNVVLNGSHLGVDQSSASLEISATMLLSTLYCQSVRYNWCAIAKCSWIKMIVVVEPNLKNSYHYRQSHRKMSIETTKVCDKADRTIFQAISTKSKRAISAIWQQMSTTCCKVSRLWVNCEYPQSFWTSFSRLASFGTCGWLMSQLPELQGYRIVKQYHLCSLTSG